DQAIRDLVRSAFGHDGQKCSAASLAVCEAEVYEDAAFRRQLRDAAESLPVGSAWEPASRITPLTQAPGEALRRALTTLEPGEEWLLEPRAVSASVPLWSPGIKLGVRPGSFFHLTECFGPVLGLMRAADLEEALALVDRIPFGLTSGIQSLDDREIARWLDRVAAGNLYVNRHITGAIVARQPFGGWKASVVGPGAKAGGPNYVAQLGRWRQAELPAAGEPLSATLARGASTSGASTSGCGCRASETCSATGPAGACWCAGSPPPRAGGSPWARSCSRRGPAACPSRSAWPPAMGAAGSRRRPRGRWRSSPRPGYSLGSAPGASSACVRWCRSRGRRGPPRTRRARWCWTPRRSPRGASSCARTCGSRRSRAPCTATAT